MNKIAILIIALSTVTSIAHASESQKETETRKNNAQQLYTIMQNAHGRIGQLIRKNENNITACLQRLSITEQKKAYNSFNTIIDQIIKNKNTSIEQLQNDFNSDPIAKHIILNTIAADYFDIVINDYKRKYAATCVGNLLTASTSNPTLHSLLNTHAAAIKKEFGSQPIHDQQMLTHYFTTDIINSNPIALTPKKIKKQFIKIPALSQVAIAYMAPSNGQESDTKKRTE